MEKKTCPIPPGDNGLKNCSENCAWYDTENERCAILQIFYVLSDIEVRL